MIGNPLGLLALLAIPAIVVLHLYRRRFTPLRIAGLFLWDRPPHDASAGRRRHRLETDASFWIELLLALLLAIYLAEPTLGGSRELEHHVVVLDDSASMGARGEGFDVALRARRAVEEAIGDSRRDLVTVVAAAERPRVIVGPSAPREAARDALESWRPGTGRADLDAGIALARQIAGPDRRVVVVTDRPRDDAAPPAPDLAWRAVGRSAFNAGILAADRARTPSGRDAIFVRIGAFGRAPAEGVRVMIRAGERTLIDEAFAADAAEIDVLREIDAGEEDVTVQLGADASPADDVAILPVPPRRLLRCAVAMAEGSARSAVLGALAVMPDVEVKAAGGAAHLLFSDAAADAAVPSGATDAGTWTFTIAASPDAVDLLGPFLADRTHPLLEGTSFEGVIWRGAGAAPEGLEPLLSAGENLLVGRDPRARPPAFLMQIDLGAGTLVRSADWPVLVANLVAMRRDALPGCSRSAVRVGEGFEVVLPAADPSGHRALGPGGRTIDLPALPRVWIDGLREPGVWSIGREGEAPLVRIAVNAQDAEESDLRAARSGRVEAARDADRRRVEEIIDERLHLALGALIVLALLAHAFWLQRARAGRIAA